MTPPRTLVFFAPAWQVTALGGGPDRLLAVVEKGRIFATTPAARARGVRPGQRRREAAWHCPLLEIAARDEGVERRAFAPVVTALEAFGAAVTVRRPGWAWIATRGPARYFGGEEALAAAVASAVRACGIGWSEGDDHPGIGIADGPFAATLAAQRGLVVRRAETAAFLAPLSIEHLQNPRLAEVLRNLGIVTLGAFAALDSSDVLARFGWDGARIQRIAKGEEEPNSPLPRDVHIATEVTAEFEEPAALVEEVVLVARRLAEELCTEVRRAGLSFSLLTVAAETDDAEQSIRQWSHDGSFTTALVVERVRWQLQAWMRPQRDDGASQLLAGVVHLRLAAEELTLDVGRQDQLFGRSSTVEDQVMRSLARVQGMLGPEGVLQAQVVGGRGPLEQIELLPFGDRRALGLRPADRPWPGRLPAPSPTLVFSDPLVVELQDAAGRSVRVDAKGDLSNEPATLLIGGVSSPVDAWAGPWPIDERWWESGRRRRARFQLVVGPEAYLVVLERGSFFLEGRYD